jgi:sulfur-oxidizing protein SoxY
LSPWAARCIAGAGLALAALAAAATQLQPGDDPAASAVWQKVRASLFETRQVLPAPAGWLSLEAPARAVDAAVVPIAIRARIPAAGGGPPVRVYLVIDANPSPISAIFQLAAVDGAAEVETRVRVDDYSFVRAIAETADGRLYGVTRFVKASGGCSAPAGGDPQAALASMGQMRFRIEGGDGAGAPLLAQLVISHPNHSGLAMDQATRQFTPAHYVRKVDVSYDGAPVFSADVDFSMSENPNFRFRFVPHRGGELRATVLDSQGRHFEAVQSLADAPR